MAQQRYTTEEIIHKLREADVLIGQGKSIAEAGLPPTGAGGNHSTGGVN